LRRIIVLLAWLASTALGLAAEPRQPGDFTTATESIMANLRVAASYVRTGNIALAQIEMDEANAAWKRLQDEAIAAPLPSSRPAALADFIAKGRERLTAVIGELDGGDNTGASRDLLALRQSFHDLRRNSGLYQLGDCVFEIAPAMEKLRIAATGFGESSGAARAEDIVAAAGAFRTRVQLCNDLASADISRQPEFRRLIDGAIASAGEIAHAAMAGDGALVHRYLIELQSYAQLLDFRFG
jgi:hypothetical protein